MASQADQQKELQKALRQKAAALQQKAFEKEKERCEQIGLTELGAEKASAGNRQGETCDQIYQESPGYIEWLNDHQAKNMKFLHIRIYAQRMFALEMNSGTVPVNPVPKAAPYTGSRQPTPPQPSGNMLPKSDSEDEWIHEVPKTEKDQQQEEMKYVMQSMMNAFTEMKAQMNEIHRTANENQTAIQQTVGALQTIRQTQENQDRRMSTMEELIHQQ